MVNDTIEDLIEGKYIELPDQVIQDLERFTNLKEEQQQRNEHRQFPRLLPDFKEMFGYFVYYYENPGRGNLPYWEITR